MTERARNCSRIRARRGVLRLTALLVAASFAIAGRPVFTEVTEASGLPGAAGLKYGGPMVADLDQDGDYDLFLGQHNDAPGLLLKSRGDGTFTIPVELIQARDVHGVSAGDYDLDGDLDLFLSFGGALKGTPPRLYRNQNGQFSKATNVGLEQISGRGRAVLPADFDGDGDLDLLVVCAASVGALAPKNRILENLGGVFAVRSQSGLEAASGQRALVLDFDRDGNQDVLFFSPVALFRGDGALGFRDVSREALPEGVPGMWGVQAVAEIDLENDGDRDLYLARGRGDRYMVKSFLEFEPRMRSLAFRDQGNLGRNGFTFLAPGPVRLSGLAFDIQERAGRAWPLLFVGRRELATGPGFEFSVEPEEAVDTPSHPGREGWSLRYLGADRWRFEWTFVRPTWHIDGTLRGVHAVETTWPRTSLELPDRLLENRDGIFVDASDRPGIPPLGNHRGVTVGDLDNDGFEDLVVYRYGSLLARLPDYLLRNRHGESFALTTAHGMRPSASDGHGEMAQAFDYDLDGRLDVLAGSDDRGRWHLYRNVTPSSSSGRSLLVSVAPRPGPVMGAAALGAMVQVEAEGRTWTRRVGSAGISSTQSHLGIVHFGLGEISKIDRVTVRWTNGREQSLYEVPVGGLLRFPFPLGAMTHSLPTAGIPGS